jgi:predicted nucleotidyltransferase
MRPTHTIEDLLGSRSRIAVLRVLHGVSVPLNASQIAARAKLSHVAAASVLSDFASMGVVHSTPAGRATVHWLNRESVYVENMLEPLFQAERDVPEDLLDDLAWAFQDEAISVVLFGSYARGDQTPGSDVDVALVADGPDKKSALESAIAAHASEFRSRFGASLSALTYTREEAAALRDTSSNLAESLCRDGIVVSGLSPWDWRDHAEE